jgi:hypothetical protein
MKLEVLYDAFEFEGMEMRGNGDCCFPAVPTLPIAQNSK